MAVAASGGVGGAVGVSRRILVVEDNPVEKLIIRTALNAAAATEFDITAASSIRSALRNLRSGAFDAIVLDLGLPDASGLEGLSRLLVEQPDAAIVIMSATESPATIEAALRLGAEDYIIKDDFDGAALVRALTFAIERRRRYSDRLTSNAVASDDEIDITRATVTRVVRDAISNDHLALAYQPVVDLRSSTMVGVEALLRMTERAARGMSIEQCITAAERSGLITTLGRWVFRTATEQAGVWHAAGHIPLRTAINVSAKQLDVPSLADEVIALLERADIFPTCIAIELTETMLIEAGQVGVHCLSELRERGIPIGLDDFGTGYSSLRHLRDLPVDFVKIDQSFVRRVPEDPETCAIVRGVIGILHDLGLMVVAEGVERAEQADFLTEEGCDLAQGYLFGRPTHAASITARLVAHAANHP